MLKVFRYVNEFVLISELSDKIYYLASELYTVMFLYIMVNQLHGRLIISHVLIYFSTHCTTYDTISITSLKITQAFHLLLGFTEN